jgi:putative transposase
VSDVGVSLSTAVARAQPETNFGLVPRPLRSDLPNGFFHVTARGVAHARIFLDDDDRRQFLALLAGTVQRYHWDCFAFCLMTTHYHLVLETTRERLSRGVQRLNGRHAQAFNARHVRRGHLFGARFASWVIANEQHLGETCRYVLLNPVRAGLCRSPAEWRWSASRFAGTPA